MRKMILFTALLCCTTATAATAQARRPAPQAAPSANWVTVYGQMYTHLSGFNDPGTNSDWVFDDNAFGLGLALQRDFGGLLLGVDGSLARTAYERRVPGTGVAVPNATGDASVATAMATGRFGYGGATDLGFYLAGGIGTIMYRLEDVAEWNADFALQAGTGLEYRMAPNRAVFLEWGRIWGYHEREGIGGGAAQHSVLKLGARFGL
jgi:opacity protein-like surface antigen